MKVTITKKNGRQGNLFIGTPYAKGQVVVATFSNPTQAAKWYQHYNGEWHGTYSSYGRTIKAEYSQRTIYYDLSTLRSKEFWKDIFGTSKKAKAAKAKAEAAKTEAEAKEAKRLEAIANALPAKRDDLKAWKDAGAIQPCSPEILKAKHASGLSWSDFVKAI